METSLSAKEICTIIKASKDSGVKSITASGLTIEFYPHRNEASDAHRNVEPGTPEEFGVADAETKIPAEWGDQAEMFDRQVISDAEEAALMVDDPMAFEKHIVSRDMERNRMMDHG